MNDDKTITQHDIDEVKVKLVPVFGIAPKYYIAVVYALVILAALFITLLLPGIRKPGVHYSFVVDPPESALFVDGAYVGHAPCEVFINAGDHDIRIERPGFSAWETTINVRGRLFGTLLFKPRDAMLVSLESTDAMSILKPGMASYASWALAGTPSEAYQIPMDLSDAARAAMIRPGNPIAAGFAGAAVSYAAHAQSLRDAVRATAIVYGNSSTVSPVTMGRLVSRLLEEIGSDPSIIVSLTSSAPVEIRDQIKKSDYFKTTVSKILADSSIDDMKPGSTRSVGGQEFIPLQFSGASGEKTFFMAVSETTVGGFRKFVAANPEWAPAATASLVDRGLCDADYLKGFADADDADVLRYVSRPAAAAYCEWLTGIAPPGFQFSLPSEAQWALAAAASGKSASMGAILLASENSGPVAPRGLPKDAAGFKALLGNVWEWCSDSFAAHPETGIEGRLSFPSTEAVVRGGSWANRADLVKLESRGPMPESRCTAYLGFRIALIPTGD